MKKKNKNIIVISLVVILLILSFVLFRNPQTIFDFKGEYTITDTSLGYDIEKISNRPFGDSSFNGINGVPVYITNKEILNTFGTDVKKISGATRSTDTFIARTKNLNVDLSTLNKLTIDYNDDSNLIGCDTRSTNGQTESYSEIYLANSNNEVLLYKGKSLFGGLNGQDSYINQGRITITRNEDAYIIDLNGEKSSITDFDTDETYEIAIRTFINTMNCGSSPSDSTTYEHSLTINRLDIDLLEQIQEEDIPPTTLPDDLPSSNIIDKIIPNIIKESPGNSFVIYAIIIILIGGMIVLGYQITRRFKR